MKKLIKLIPVLCANSYSHADLSEFLSIARPIVKRYLRSLQYSFGYRILWDKRPGHADEEFDQITDDCLAALLEKDENGGLPNLKVYFWKFYQFNSTPTNEHLEGALHRLLIKHTQQEVDDMFHRRDPTGWKIYRNVMIAAKKHPHWELIKVRGAYFIYRKSVFMNERYGRSNRPLIPPDELERRCPIRHCYYGRQIKRQIDLLLRAVDTARAFRNCVPLRVASFVIRRAVERELIAQAWRMWIRENRIDPDLELDREALQRRIMREMDKKLGEYLRGTGGRRGGGKKIEIDGAKVEIYRCALVDILSDLLEWIELDAYWRYLGVYISDYNGTRYRREDRRQFEYLCKLLKGWFIHFAKIFDYPIG